MNILLATGILLIVIGSLILAVYGFKVEVYSRAVEIPYLDAKWVEPGNYTKRRIMTINETNIMIRDKSEVTIPLILGPSPANCIDEPARFLSIVGEGVVRRVKPFVLNLTVRLYNGVETVLGGPVTIDPSRIPHLSGQSTAPPSLGEQKLYNGLVNIDAISDGNSIILKMSGERVNLPLVEGILEIHVSSNETLDETGIHVRVADECTVQYEVKEGRVEFTRRYQHINIPYVAGIDDSKPRLGIALIGLGNVLTLVGIYVSLRKGLDRLKAGNCI